MADKPDLAWLTARPIAHRGYHNAAAGRIENTLPAFEAAAARGFAIECDVWECAGGDVVVFHDHTLDRLTTASGRLVTRTFGELTAVRFQRAPSEVRIPRLAELLDMVGGRVPLVIELKAEAGVSGAGLARAVAAELQDYHGPVAVMAFEPPTMIAMRRIAPALPRGMIVDAFAARDYPGVSAPARFALRHLLAAPVVRPAFTACDMGQLPGLMPRAMRRLLGRPALAWTVRSTDDRAKASPWADQIIFEGFDPEAAPLA